MSQERTRPDDFTAGPAPYSDDFGGVATAERYVEVVHGVHAHSLPLVGMTIARARGELAERMNIDPAAVAVLDGNSVPEDTVLAEGQVLHFISRSGEKGFRGAQA